MLDSLDVTCRTISARKSEREKEKDQSGAEERTYGEALVVLRCGGKGEEVVGAFDLTHTRTPHSRGRRQSARLLSYNGELSRGCASERRHPCVLTGKEKERKAERARANTRGSEKDAERKKRERERRRTTEDHVGV